jgi:signal transduction histidine kinase
LTGKPLRVLIVEDSELDADLLLAELHRVGYDVRYERVETAPAMRAALERDTWDIVISDYSMPTFSAPAALEVLKASGRDLPFVIVSGTIGEETAVSALKSGAHDFLLKGQLSRLAPALEREFRDVAARRDRTRLEAQLRQSQKMEAIGQLAGGIAHDFNNLLTAILGYAELVHDRVRDMPDAVADVQEIRKAGERAAGLTRQLLAFSRKQLLDPRVLDLNHVIADVEKMLHRIIGEDVRLETRASATTAHVKADRSQIEQVLLNLAVNARDAMPSGGTLSIQTGCSSPPDEVLDGGTAEVDAWVSMVFADTGCGIPLEVQARMFEPFFTTKAPGSGTGLGLSTVYGIVSQSGGCIGVESRVGVGSTITIYLPAVGEAIESIGLPPVLAADAAGHETILVVEDDTGIRTLIRRVLAPHGYTLLEASDGVEALAVAARHTGVIHLLLTDIVMPELGGPELAQRIVTQRPDIAVLYMSGYASRIGLNPEGLGMKANRLAKPFTPAALLSKIRESLGDS